MSHYELCYRFGAVKLADITQAHNGSVPSSNRMTPDAEPAPFSLFNSVTLNRHPYLKYSFGWYAEAEVRPAPLHAF